MRFVFPILLAVVLVGCSEKDSFSIVEREGELPVVTVADDDAQMMAAEKKAQDTLDEFLAELQKKPAGAEFFVKTGIATPEGSEEHIWVDRVTYRDGVFEGFLGNEPVNLPQLHAGSPVKVKREDVEDWIIMKGEDMTGGYTVKVIADKASKE